MLQKEKRNKLNQSHLTSLQLPTQRGPHLSSLNLSRKKKKNEKRKRNWEDSSSSSNLTSQFTTVINQLYHRQPCIGDAPSSNNISPSTIKPSRHHKHLRPHNHIHLLHSVSTASATTSPSAPRRQPPPKPHSSPQHNLISKRLFP